MALCLSGPGWAEQITLKHLYTVDRHSGSLRFLTPVAVFFDARRQEIYLSDAGTSMVVTLARDGRSLGYFYHRLKGQSKKIEPAGVAVNSKGTVFVSDAAEAQIYTYDYRGKPLGRIPMPDGKDGPLLPGKMALDKDDNLYVAARNAGKAVVFDPEGRVKREIVGDFGEACDVAVDESGKVYMLSPKGTAVHIFDAGGRHMDEFGAHSPGKASFSRPAALDVDGKGRLWIVDSVAQVVKVFRPDGEFIEMFGGLGTGDGAFFFPIDVYVDRASDTLFVLEKNGRRLQAFAIQEK
jgi:sugar lactone lactonase YvrE